MNYRKSPTRALTCSHTKGKVRNVKRERSALARLFYMIPGYMCKTWKPRRASA